MIGMVVDAFATSIRRQPPPRAIVAERVIHKMARQAVLYPDRETAEVCIGLVTGAGRGEPDIYLLDTIAPDQDTIHRATHMVEQGDDLQDEIMYWLSINWKRLRPTLAAQYGPDLAAKWNVPLRYLGDWHKQPGTMYQPSHGDLMTAQEIVLDEQNNMPQLIAPIVTLAPRADGVQGDEYDVFATMDTGDIVRINFWYLSRGLARAFVAARPVIRKDSELPALPPIGWHLKDRLRFQQEYDHLTRDKLAVSITEFNAVGEPPLEICFMAARADQHYVIVLSTSLDFPAAAPAVRVAPMLRVAQSEDMFQRLWDASQPFDLDKHLPDWSWHAERILLDLVQAVEQKLADLPELLADLQTRYAASIQAAGAALAAAGAEAQAAGNDTPEATAAGAGPGDGKDTEDTAHGEDSSDDSEASDGSDGNEASDGSDDNEDNEDNEDSDEASTG